MKAIAYLNGKVFHPHDNSLRITNILLHNGRCIGMGYIPDDDSVESVDLKGNLILLNLCTWGKELSPEDLQQNGFQKNFYPGSENKTVPILPDTSLTSLKSILTPDAPPHLLEIHPNSNPSPLFSMLDSCPQHHLITLPVTWLLQPTDALLSFCQTHTCTVVAHKPQDLSLILPLMFTQLWDVLSKPDFFNLLQLNLMRFFDQPRPSLSLNSTPRLTCVNIRTPEHSSRVNAQIIGTLYSA